MSGDGGTALNETRVFLVEDHGETVGCGLVMFLQAVFAKGNGMGLRVKELVVLDLAKWPC